MRTFGPSAVSVQTERAIRATRSIDIIMRYAAGVSVANIEDLHECSRNTVLRHARSAGLAKRPKGFDTAKRKLIDRELKKGTSLAEIKRTCACSEAYASKRAAELGLRRYSTIKGQRNKKAHSSYKKRRVNPKDMET